MHSSIVIAPSNLLFGIIWGARFWIDRGEKEGVFISILAMVGASEERELERLEKQVEEGGGGVVEYLSLVRKLKVRRSNIVAKHGLQLLNQASARSKLGSDLWTVYEQVAIACMDCHALDSAKKCINALDSKFPDSMRVGRLEGMWYEAKGSWQKAEKVYSNLLSENPSDTVAHKRRIAMAKAQGNMTVAVEGLNKYLETFMADYDAWRELADIYTSLQMYKQAGFCFEELILSQPTNALYHLGYAELLYTMGGIDNLRTARKYYASTIELSGGKNMRALYGVCLCGAAINQARGRGRTEEESQELVSLAASVLVKKYKEKASSKAGLVSSILDKYKQLAVA